MMRKQYLRILIALISVAGFGLTARGQAVDQITVNIPYEFVVSGKILPAGDYKLYRLDQANGANVLLLTSFKSRANVLVLPNQHESGFADKAFVKFELYGEQHFLTTIQTGDNLFTIPVSRKQIMEAQAAAKSHMGTTTPVGSAGNN
jgi:hypothetical protein